MCIEDYTFGSIRIDGVLFKHDVVIDRGEVIKRNKKASKQFRQALGHTPLSIEEKIPWKCQRLVIGTGTYGAMTVMNEVRREAERRRVELVILPTSDAIELLKRKFDETNAILHITC